ncbi:hypothetical protein [uncultured Aliiroseovarius sp.]|uniref:hypothetical protein n=1 Tax=uncultured Aliiroseovarius sp. TaxID=1658783 RepID=UPI002631E633|nr:hypothetical protein [uncultured Aliiroseovarius sp.]
MTRKTDRDSLRQELSALLAGLEFYRSWAIDALEIENGHVTQEVLDQIVMPSSFYLDVFDDAPDARCSQVLTEVRNWYSHTAKDLPKQRGEKEAQTFFDGFQDALGFDFHTASKNVRNVAEKALKQKQILNDEDYETLFELETNLSQHILNAEEMGQISRLLRLFEDAQK